MADGWAIGAWCEVGKWAIEKLWKNRDSCDPASREAGVSGFHWQGCGFSRFFYCCWLVDSCCWLLVGGYWLVADSCWRLACG
ncbi:MAG TPA: hypothetical protein DDY43_01215 [Synechococcales bacterium UBA10510]|nr:hypothetical protein [Synechococcales bacterium UBA10510]